jgi:quinol monooxygenase YgiN
MRNGAAGSLICMVIVTGHLIVAPQERASYLAGCVEVVRQAREAPGCLDFAIGADLLDPGRVNILERWQSQEAVNTFRGSGPSDEQQGTILSGSVTEYDVAKERSLF